MLPTRETSWLSQIVTSPRLLRPRSYSLQFLIPYFVLYLRLGGVLIQGHYLAPPCGDRGLEGLSGLLPGLSGMLPRNHETAHLGKPRVAKPAVLASFSQGWAQEPEGSPKDRCQRTTLSPSR